MLIDIGFFYFTFPSSEMCQVLGLGRCILAYKKHYKCMYVYLHNVFLLILFVFPLILDFVMEQMPPIISYILFLKRLF